MYKITSECDCSAKKVTFLRFRFSDAPFSRISKFALLASFTELVHTMRGWRVPPPPGFEGPDKTYYELKANSEDYQQAKAVLVKRLEQSGWGRWVGKPIEEDLFTSTYSNTNTNLRDWEPPTDELYLRWRPTFFSLMPTEMLKVCTVNISIFFVSD